MIHQISLLKNTQILFWKTHLRNLCLVYSRWLKIVSRNDMKSGRRLTVHSYI